MAHALTVLMIKAVGVESADMNLLNQLSFGWIENMPPCAVSSPGKVLARALNTVMIKAVGVKCAIFNLCMK